MIANTQQVETVLLSAPEVAGILGCSVRHLWRMADTGHFPRPLSLGTKLKKWQRREIERWLSDQSLSSRR